MMTAVSTLYIGSLQNDPQAYSYCRPVRPIADFIKETYWAAVLIGSCQSGVRPSLAYETPQLENKNSADLV